MKDILLIPDSFKGTMSSAEVCDVMEKAIRTRRPNASVVPLPVADGGEGSVDAFLTALGGERVALRVTGPFMEEVDAFYGILPGGERAVIEMAACAGLPLVEGRADPARTTTYGVGQLMAHALSRGCTTLIVGLGGSATNDLGCGMAAALGFRFLNAAGKEFVPTGGTLADIHTIESDGRLPALSKATVVGMCDIDNPLYGPSGAAHIFAPQKGADAALVATLDRGLRAAAGRIKTQLGADIANLPGAGAAGGLGGGLVAFAGGRLQMGIDTVLDALDFDRRLENASLVFTGEGKLDSQSLRGKVVIGVGRRCKRAGVPLVAVVGDIDGTDGVYEEGVTAVFSINRKAVPFAQARATSKEDLYGTMENIIRILEAPT